MGNDNFFTVIEGLDGTGKTEISKLLKQTLSRAINDQVLLTFQPHDPSGGGVFIRRVLMKQVKTFTTKELALFFAANRFDHCQRVIEPFLRHGEQKILICDRYYLSSLVYQSDDSFPMEQVMALNEGVRTPDIILFFDATNKTVIERMHKRAQAKELFEKNRSISATRAKYKRGIEFLRQRGVNTIEIDANGTKTQVLNQVLTTLKKFGPEWFQTLPIQPALHAELDGEVFTLNGKRTASLHDVTRKFTAEIDFASNLSEETLLARLQELAKNVTGSLLYTSFDDLGSLFLDYVETQGYRNLGRNSWSELAAFDLAFDMPLGVTQHGIALFIGEIQRLDVVLRKAMEIHDGMSDFMLIFAPRRPDLLRSSYLERNRINYTRKRTAQDKESGFEKPPVIINRLSPTVVCFTEKDLIDVVLSRVVEQIFHIYVETFRAQPELKELANEFVAEFINRYALQLNGKGRGAIDRKDISWFAKQFIAETPPALLSASTNPSES